MKNRICLILALLMLVGVLGGCANNSKDAAAVAPVETPAPIEKTPEPAPEPTSRIIQMQEIPKTPKPEPTVNPNAAHKNTDEEITEIAKRYCDDYFEGGFDIDRFRDDMMYVQASSSDDLFKVCNKNLKFINNAPYNIGIKDLGNAESQFATSKQLAEELGEDAVIQLTKKAIWYMDYTVSNYPKEMKVERQKKLYLECGFTEERAQQLAEERIAFYEANPFTRECMIYYDKAATYRATDGTYRTRCEYNAIMREASEEYVATTGFDKEDVGRWRCCPAEVVMYPDEAGNPLDYEILFLGDMQYSSKSESKTLEKDLNA